MIDLGFYNREINNLELTLLNNYLITLNFSNQLDENELKYSLITLDKNSNIHYQAHLLVVQEIFKYFLCKYINQEQSEFLFNNMEIFKKKNLSYNLSLNPKCIEDILENISPIDILNLLEYKHTSYLNTEIVLKNGCFKYVTSKINSKNTGSVYTQNYITDEICEKTFLNKLENIKNTENLKILDFGAATGRFYFSMLNVMLKYTQKNVSDIITENLFAIDIDEIAINILRLRALTHIDNITNDAIKKLFTNIICKNMLLGQKLSLFGNDETLLNITNDFNGIIPNGGFDIIVSNPPYAILKVNKKNNSSIVLSRYYKELTKKVNEEINYFNNSNFYLYSNEGMLNYYKLSIEMMLNISKNDASIGVICPSTLFTDCSSKQLRKHLLLNHRISEINYFPENASLFDNVSQSTVIFYLQKSQKTDKITVKIGKETFEINIKDIIHSFANLEIPYINKIGWQILNKLSKHQKLKENKLIRNKRGELDLTLYKKYITTSPTKFRLVRGNMINSDLGIVDKNKEYVLEEFISNKSEEYLKNDFNQVRLICQQISNIDSQKRLNFTISNKNDIIANSCNYLTLKKHSGLASLLDIMNSYLLNWRFKVSSGNNHINNYELDELPLIDIEQKFMSKNKLDLNIEICKKYNLSNEETRYILKDYYNDEILSEKLGELINV